MTERPPLTRAAFVRRVGALPPHPLLIAAYPVLFLYGQNVGELTVRDLVVPLLVVVGLAALALVVAALVLRDGRRAALIVSALAVPLLMYGHAAGLVEPYRVPGIVQQAGWGLLFVAAVVIALRLDVRRLAGLTRGLNFMAALLVVLSLVSIVPAEIARFGRSTPTIGDVEGSGGADRDILYLILDRYGSRASLESLYGWDDGPFLQGLRDRGFVIPADSHANYLKTTLSLAATLNLNFLDDIVAAQGPASGDYGPVFARLSDHAVGRFLKERGYEYLHLGSWYDPTRTSSIADRNLVAGGPSDFVSALEEASALPALRRRLGLNRSAPIRERAFAVTGQQLDTLDALADDPGRSFVFAHVLLPHPPYVFEADGSFVTEDAYRGLSVAEHHERQMTYLQTRINALVDRLLARPEAERPIIILQGDEGPFPFEYAADTVNFDWATASDEDVMVKFGILNAMYLPGESDVQPPEPFTSVNTFRFLFNRYFGTDLELLPNRAWTSAGKLLPYDMTEVTDRLPALRGGP